VSIYAWEKSRVNGIYRPYRSVLLNNATLLFYGNNNSSEGMNLLSASCGKIKQVYREIMLFMSVVF
jgi:hypothetical protein